MEYFTRRYSRIQIMFSTQRIKMKCDTLVDKVTWYDKLQNACLGYLKIWRSSMCDYGAMELVGRMEM